MNIAEISKLESKTIYYKKNINYFDEKINKIVNYLKNVIKKKRELLESELKHNHRYRRH